MVEESSLFNPYFLGSSFKWWVAQIPEDGTWRENISCQSPEGADTQKGWGYRYKVRVLGVHDKDEEIVKSEDLPWAQVCILSLLVVVVQDLCKLQIYDRECSSLDFG